MFVKEYVNSPDNLEYSKIKYRQFFYFKCANCGQISEQPYLGEKNIRSVCKKCYKMMSIEKTKKTLLEKYGVDNVAKIPKVKEKMKQTNLKKYGCIAPAQNESIKNKQRETLKKKYGNTNPGAQANHEKFIKYRSTQSQNLDLIWLDQENFRGKYDENGPILYKFKCIKCGNLFEDDFHSREPICKVCNPSFVGKSKLEDGIYNYISAIYDGQIIRHDRKLLNGKELDFYFPDKKIAIEFNGTYWHGYRKDSLEKLSEFRKKTEWKRLECQKLGIRLINIDECDFLNRPEVFNRFFEDLLCERKRIFARQCKFVTITKQEAKDFCEHYHVNGYRNSSECYGLKYNDELICVATFARHKKYGWECIRLCYKTGISIIGGWEKIQKHFGRQFLHYVNLKYFEGENKTGCGYRFVFNRTDVVYRNQLQTKDQLKKWCKNIDEKLSAFNNCLMNNGIAVFDCGNDIRIYN